MTGTRWPRAKLADHVDLVSGFPFKSAGFTGDPQDIPLVKGENVQQGYIDWDKAKRWPRDQLEGLEKYWLKPGDVILAMDRPWIEAGLKQACIQRHDPPSLLVQRVSRLRGVNGLSTAYLRQLIASSSFTDYIKPIVTGINVPHISGAQIKGFEFPLPPPHAQQRIASILCAYDDLIENNTRRISILEEMARRVYEEWFVRFRFPGHEGVRMVESELGLVPEGWTSCRLERVCSRMNSGNTPSRSNPDYWDGGTVAWYKTKELWDGYLFESEERVSELAVTEKKTRVFEAGTILMAIYGSPTVGRLGITTDRCACNQAALGMLPDPTKVTFWMLYYTLLALRAEFNNKAQGAAQQNISKEKVAEMPFLLPAMEIQRRFDEVVGPMQAMLRNIQERNRNLRATRDLLLPKLISGELDVSALPEPEALAA